MFFMWSTVYSKNMVYIFCLLCFAFDSQEKLLGKAQFNATNKNREEQPGCRLSLSMHGSFSEKECHTHLNKLYSVGCRKK